MGATITAMNTSTNTGTLPTFAWNNLADPGCYLIIEWGCLARVPKDGVADGRSPKITFFGNTHPTCCKLSDDPYICVSKARQIAADYDYNVNF